MFIVKDSIHNALRSQVVYKFICAGCHVPAMSVKPLDILASGFVSTYFWIAIPISINIGGAGLAQW